MKVAMLGWEFPPFMAGGLGIHCLEITQDLARQGVALDFYMPHMASVEGGLRVREHHSHLDIKEVEADPGLSPYGGNGGGNKKKAYERNFNAAVALYNQRLVASFDSFDADVLHAHDWITVPAALELKRLTGKPLVLTMHSLENDRSAGFCPQQWIADIERQGVHGADRVIAVSHYTKKLLVEQYGVPTGKIVPVHNGIDANKFHDAAVRDYAKGRGTVLFLSRLSRQKGPLYFLQAARRVLQVRPEARFVMAGTGEMLGECIQYTLQHGIADRVTFTGFVGNDDLADFYSHNDLYVLPSVSEPFGISVLEAMATGLPTIVSKSCGVGEALHHVLRSEYHDIDEMASMIVALLDSPTLREEMGRNGAREAQRFTWAACARKTLGVYRSLAPAARAPARVPAPMTNLLHADPATHPTAHSLEVTA
ncbi:MAG TPA: glycosyltransferase family 4 protein [Candidatus Thermoplasmatota archaeon]|nr:glycosyltransferase family 4 protein [Candidatus Thermoplasmatota archaeon]